eukprot:CAMPEP_0173122898 /NCGR_PEP_ID=MMETSP1102-20130122/54523_1 /TAXON_ID=49646 /ORGANISM="Geminigera sp., Strain Caron Lab Isolate" /LENGTH=33 /DNA_ID= /DNA_START= /DNA_END= /DNA_ORIENTATION=
MGMTWRQGRGTLRSGSALLVTWDVQAQQACGGT